MKRLTGIVIAAACCLGMMVNGEVKSEITKFQITVCDAGMKLAHNNTPVVEVMRVIGAANLNTSDSILLLECYDSVMQDILKGKN